MTGNTANRNAVTGIAIVEGANNNVVSRNVANGNQGETGDGAGIIVGQSTGNQLIGNVANSNLGSGIMLAEDKAGDTTGNSLKSNAANKNRGHGIDATARTADGGGNRASGNATPPPCVNVVCSGSRDARVHFWHTWRWSGARRCDGLAKFWMEWNRGPTLLVLPPQSQPTSIC